MDKIFLKRLEQEIERFEPRGDIESVGHVVSVGDGVAEIEGLSAAVMSEMVLFDEGSGTVAEALATPGPLYGLVLNLEEESVRAVILGDTARVKEGMVVKRVGRVLSIPVSETLVGRVVNPLGEPLDGKGRIDARTLNPIERIAPGVIERQSVNTPLHTGIKAIDAMIPIGRGQRELIIGDRFSGKTTLAIDTILNQKNEPESSRPVCIYVAIGQKESKTARLVALLSERGSMEYSIVVEAPASAPAALQFLAPFAGAAIGEYFMEQGKDAVVIYDDLSKQATAYRQMSLLLRRPPGREAYPGDIFYLHSRLLERAAKLSKERGGGSLTALPIIETQEGDVSAYIPTNVISITDGQIYLDTDLFNKGVKPAINVGLSVSRVGSNAQTTAMKKVAGKLRLELAQFRELEAFMQFSQDLDPDTKRRIETGSRLAQVLVQGKHVPMSFEYQVPLLYAATHGMFESVPLSQIAGVESAFISYLDAGQRALILAIRESRELSADIEKMLDEACKTFASAHPELFA